MTEPELAPVALFAYDRPDHLARVARALAGNAEARNTRLHIFSDAPKSDRLTQAVAEVRAVAKTIAGFRSVNVIEQDSNLGVARSIIDGVSNLTSRFGKVIVLEDDLLPSPYFLRYVNQALSVYREVTEVISIAAYFPPSDAQLPSTFFLRGADCWGWATWRRGWELFERDGSKLLAELESRKLSRAFDLDGRYPFTQMLRDQLAGKNDSWAIRWHASAFLLGKLTLYPGSSQIQNIGADGSGMNVPDTDAFHHVAWGQPVELNRIPLQEYELGREAFARGLHGKKSTLARRIFKRIAQLGSHFSKE